MAKIMRQTLREQVTQAIRLKLLTGQLRPGERIVEQEMAEDLGVSPWSGPGGTAPDRAGRVGGVHLSCGMFCQGI